jgi:hypothetical protein
MQAIKWIRKNKQTIVLFVVVLYADLCRSVGLQELLTYMGEGGKVTIAEYEDGKITNEDMSIANQELEIRTPSTPTWSYSINPMLTHDESTANFWVLLFSDPGSIRSAAISPSAQRGKSR